MSGKRARYVAYDRDQVAKWKTAIAARQRQQRQRRGRRVGDVRISDTPGMIRKPPESPTVK